VATVPSLGRGGAPVTDAHATLLGVLGLHPSSAEFHYRYAQSIEQLVNQAGLTGWAEALYAVILRAGLDGPALDLLGSFGYDGERPPLLDLYFHGRQAPLTGPLVDDRPLSETEPVRVWAEGERNYLEWLLDAAETSLDALRSATGFVDAVPNALLFLLARHRSGYSADQLAIALHERDVPAVTVRAELSRLRSLVPDLGLSGRPYRLTSPLTTDVDTVRKCLARGEVGAAVDAYPGPILPSSESPEVQAERDEVHREIRSAVLGSTNSPAVLRFANRPCSREDILVWRHAVRLAAPSTRPVLVEHLLRIEHELGGLPVRAR